MGKNDAIAGLAGLFQGYAQGTEKRKENQRLDKADNREDVRLQLYKQQSEAQIKAAELQGQIHELNLNELKAKYAVATPQERQQLAWEIEQETGKAKKNEAYLQNTYGERKEKLGLEKDQAQIDQSRASTAYTNRLSANVGANNGGDNPKKDSELGAAQGLYKLWTERVEDIDKALSGPGVTPEMKQVFLQRKAEALANQDYALKAVNSGLTKYAPSAVPPPMPAQPAQAAPQQKPDVPPDTNTLSGLFRKTGQDAAKGAGNILGAIGSGISTVNEKAIPFMRGEIGTYTLANDTDVDLTGQTQEDIKLAEQYGLIKKKAGFTWPQGTGAPGVR